MTRNGARTARVIRKCQGTRGAGPPTLTSLQIAAHWVYLDCAHPAASGVHSFLLFKNVPCAGTAPKGVVAQEHFKMGLLDCFITEVAQQ